MDPGLPLIEIAAEDDSLIQQSPSLADTSASTPTNCLFSCSPFHNSPIVRLKNKGDGSKPTSSFAAGNGNKENINVNKSEMVKLSMEPQQMKRRKKTSTYNLRKSLAWDKAFSTDEGFLDPLELSMLGGSNGDSCRELLPSISEAGRKFSEYSCGRGTPKVQSNQKGSRSGLKSGCPQSLVFSSMKRPANSGTLKSGLKESKLPKLPVSKTGSQSLQNFSKSNLPSTIQSKHNQIDREDIKKVASSHSTSRMTGNITSKNMSHSHSVSLSAKLPVQQPRRNKVRNKSAEKLISESDLQPQQPSLASWVNSGLEAPIAALPLTGSSHTAAAHEVIMRNAILSAKVTVPTTMPLTEVQPKKLSGLRMPSPSLGFFSQPKSSSSRRISREATQLINVPGSSVSNSERFNALNCTYESRLPHIHGKLQKKVENNSSSGNVEVSESRAESVIVRLPENSALVKEVNISSYCKNTEAMTQKQSSIEEQMDLQKNDDWLIGDESSGQLTKHGNNLIVDFSESYISEKICQVLDKDVDESNDAIHRHHVEECHASSSTVPHETIFDSPPEGAAEVIGQDSVLMLHDDDSNATQYVDTWKTEKAEPPNAFPVPDHDVVKINGPVSDNILLEDRSFESPPYKREDFANGDSKLCESKRSEILVPNSPPHTSADQANQDISGSYHLRGECSLVDDSNCSLLYERAAAEVWEEVHGLENRLSVASELNHCDVISENRGVNQDDDAVASNIAEQPEVDASLSNAKEIICIQDSDCYIDSQVKLGRSPKTSRDYESVELFSMAAEQEVGGDDKENQILPERAEIESSSSKGFLENEKLKVVDSKILLEDHAEDPIRMMHQTNPGSAGTCQTTFLPFFTEEVDKSEMNNVTSVLCEGPKVRTSNVSNSIPIDSAAYNLSSIVCAATKVESGQAPDMQIPNLVANHICDEKYDACLNDYRFLSEGTGVEDREGKCSPISLTGKDRTDIIQVQLLMDNSGFYVGGTCEKQSMDDEPSGSINSKTFNEHDSHSLDALFKSDMILSGLATYIESDLATTARRGHTSSSMNTCGQPCLGESVVAVDTGVNKIKSISPAGTELKITQKDECLAIDNQHDQDNASYPADDAKMTLSTQRPGDGGMIGNLAIKPLVNAVPFSDEWLTAMEAAGEEILTMKRGAVQNSPTDKALPEPSPWSPVKRKQNQIGPYDCTKFINVPPNSD